MSMILVSQTFIYFGKPKDVNLNNVDFSNYMVLLLIYYYSVILLEQYPNLQHSVGQVWRFAPMADPLVFEFHSRDLDSIVSKREVEAVNEWLKVDNKIFHIMRDHKQHGSAIPGDFTRNILSLTTNTRFKLVTVNKTYIPYIY